MRTTRNSLIALVALLAGCFLGATARDLVVPARAHNDAPINYEYVVLSDGPGYSKEKFQEILNRYGQEGWHAVSVSNAWTVLERASAAAPARPARNPPTAPND